MAADTIFNIYGGTEIIKVSRSTNVNSESDEIHCTLAEVTLTTSQGLPRTGATTAEKSMRSLETL